MQVRVVVDVRTVADGTPAWTFTERRDADRFARGEFDPVVAPWSSPADDLLRRLCAKSRPWAVVEVGAAAASSDAR